MNKEVIADLAAFPAMHPENMYNHWNNALAADYTYEGYITEYVPSLFLQNCRDDLGSADYFSESQVSKCITAQGLDTKYWQGETEGQIADWFLTALKYAEATSVEAPSVLTDQTLIDQAVDSAFQMGIDYQNYVRCENRADGQTWEQCMNANE